MIIVQTYLQKDTYFLAKFDKEEKEYIASKRKIKLKRATRYWRILYENYEKELVTLIKKKLIITNKYDFESRPVMNIR
jgi:hypothetical protein